MVRLGAQVRQRLPILLIVITLAACGGCVTATATTGPTVAGPTVAALASPTMATTRTAATPPGSPAAIQPTPIPRTGGSRDLILSTTTSTQDSGLLDELLPRFEQQTGYKVKTVSVGSGAAIAL